MSCNSARSAVVLMNLGTPERPDAKAVGEFLSEFLADPRVVETPRWLWLPLLKLVIVPKRSKRVAALYRSIWTEQGSPIRVITERQVEKLQLQLQQQYGEPAPKVVYAMSYGQPSLHSVVAQLSAEGIDNIVLLPLYPQYSGASTGAIYDQVAELYRNSRNVPNLKVIKHYYHQPTYIDALANSIRRHWAEHGRNQKLLMSFHGVPQSYIDAGDPYYRHCLATAAAVADKLALSEQQWACSFQSRFGPKEWVKPYTDTLLEEWLAAGVKSVDVISPAFAADCLETLEELEGEVRELFLEGGGEKFSFIPCLNDSDEHILMMSELVKADVER